MVRLKLRLVRPANTFPIFYCPVLFRLWITARLSCSGLTGVAPSVVSCCCGPSSLRFWNAPLHSLVVTSVAFLSTSLSILLSPLTSTRHFSPHNCCSLNIFSLSDPSLWTLVCGNPSGSAAFERLGPDRPHTNNQPTFKVTFVMWSAN